MSTLYKIEGASVTWDHCGGESVILMGASYKNSWHPEIRKDGDSWNVHKRSGEDDPAKFSTLQAALDHVANELVEGGYFGAVGIGDNRAREIFIRHNISMPASASKGITLLLAHNPLR